MILSVLNDVHKEVKQEDSIQTVLVKKGVITRVWVDPSDILNVTELVKKDMSIYRTRCAVTIRDVGQVVVKHSFDSITKIKDRIKVNGFKI